MRHIRRLGLAAWTVLLGVALLTMGVGPASAGVILNHAAVYAEAMENVAPSGYHVQEVGNGTLSTSDVYADTHIYNTGQYLWGRSEASTSPTVDGLLRASASAYAQPVANPYYGGVASSQAFWTDIAYVDDPTPPRLIYAHVSVHGNLANPGVADSYVSMRIGYSTRVTDLKSPFYPGLVGDRSSAELGSGGFLAGGWDHYSYQNGYFVGEATYGFLYDTSLHGYAFSLFLTTIASSKGGTSEADFAHSLDLTGFTLADGSPVNVRFDSGMTLGSVPEPSSFVLAGIAASALVLLRRRLA